ncbi:hypothetical protein H4Q26_015694 [Puccinia striiformis f. sp. tritici PST-130]|nr:hypothetical protein H4Q26_015694 [Puccinia striiformis f. sp. tritici PST-130]
MAEMEEAMSKLTINIHIDESKGSDSTGDGSLDKPYQSILGRIHTHYNQAQDDNTGEYIKASATALKKAKKSYEIHVKKQAKATKVQSNDENTKLDEQTRLEEAKKIILSETEGEAKRIKIHNAVENRNVKVRVFGWVHRLRSQKGLIFIVLRDGTGFLQCVLTGKLAQTYDAITLTVESTIELTGKVVELPEGKSASEGHELQVDWWNVVGKAPGDSEAFNNQISEESGVDTLADRRHLVIRGETASSVLKLRSALLDAFRKSYSKLSMIEVTPPVWFKPKSRVVQLYSNSESFRAEKSKTRRHLSEYTHLEGELAFLTFDELLTHIEELICSTLTILLEDPKMKKIIESLNPSFKYPSRPFKRMEYVEAIAWLNERGIEKSVEDGGGPFTHSDDIPEAPERLMTDTIGEPIFLINFPKEIKAFYMKRIPDNPNFTESVDVLMPGVGEIVGGSMRMTGYNELLDAYKNAGISADPYYWYTDQRKYGTCEHGGYGLGVERFLAWLLGRPHVRECSLYPRYTSRCTP